MITRSALLAALLMLAPLPAAAQDSPLLASIFQDRAVLQRDRPIAVWGHTTARAQVEVTLAGSTTKTRAAKDGTWRATLPALPAGGPFELTARAGGATQTVRDLLIGDVWLCSGQSNMEWPVSAAIAGPREVAQADDPQVRILTIEKDSAQSPRADFAKPIVWKPVSKDSIGDFSAVCWFMARELRKTEKVPFGLIDSSWGGSALNPWRSEATMAGDTDLRDGLAVLGLYRRDKVAAGREWGRMWGEWFRKRTGAAAGAEPWNSGAGEGWKPVPVAELTPWEQWGVPELAEYNGILWYEVTVDLTETQAREPARLDFGIVDDLDVTWINGVGVGSTASWDSPRSYALAPGTLKPGANRIVVAAFDSWAFGGMTGPAKGRAIRFDDGTSVALPPPNHWRYRTTPGILDQPHAPWETVSGLAGLYNAMIAPLGPFGLRGAAWYQGETDANYPAGYAHRLAGLMAGWRTQFSNPALPFVIIQLPQWGARVPAPAESGFASIRDEQRKAVAADPHAALVVTIDIGDWEDLHPANKQDVGTRAARASRSVAYGAAQPPSGPRATAAIRQGDAIAIRFDQSDGALQSFSGAPLGFELCGPAPGSCRFVAARLDGATVLLDIAGGPATRVRYCWGDSPICNLYDASGLPAGPFELAVQ